MRSVTCGKAALETRRKGAYDRLGFHLKNHRSQHQLLSEEEFNNHEKAQKKEFNSLGDLLSGKSSK